MTQPTNKNKRSGKKYLVYAGMVIAFLGCLYFIFAPSAKKKEAEKQGTGFNSDIPDPRGAGIVEDKKTAYADEQMMLRRQRQESSLRDYSEMLEQQSETPDQRAEREQRQLRMAPKPPKYYEDPARFGGGGGSKRVPSRRTDYGYARNISGAIQSSASSHAELTGSLGSLFEEPKEDPEKEAMTAEIAQLKEELAERESTQGGIDDQLAMMERSYQLAAKYTGTPAKSEPVEIAPTRKTKVEPVTRVRHSVVSALAAPLSDAEFVRRFAGERNRGFNTVGADVESGAEKNTISAVVHGNQTLIDGQAVRLRTAELMLVDGRIVPQNTVITGIGRIEGERLEIVVTSIEYEGTILPVELFVHDSDGQRGIHIPGSMELEAFKEIAGNMGQSLGSTINLNQQGAGEQLLTDLGRGVIQGTSQYISKKARQVKVTLKAGYKVFLLPETDK